MLLYSIYNFDTIYMNNNNTKLHKNNTSKKTLNVSIMNKNNHGGELLANNANVYNKKEFHDSIKWIDREIDKQEIEDEFDEVYNRITNGSLVNALELYDFFLYKLMKESKINIKTKKDMIDEYAGKSALLSEFRKMIHKEDIMIDILVNRYINHRKSVELLLENVDSHILTWKFENPLIIDMFINPIRSIQLILSLIDMTGKLERTFVTTSKNTNFPKKLRIYDYDIRYRPEPGFILSMYLLTFINQLFMKRASAIVFKYPLTIVKI